MKLFSCLDSPLAAGAMEATLPQFAYSTADIKRVRRVQFGVLGPDEIVRRLVLLLCQTTVALSRPLQLATRLVKQQSRSLSRRRLGVMYTRARTTDCPVAAESTLRCRGHKAWHFQWRRGYSWRLERPCARCCRPAVNMRDVQEYLCWVRQDQRVPRPLRPH